MLILVTVALVIIPHETSRSHRQESISFLRQQLGTRTATLEHTICTATAPLTISPATTSWWDGRGSMSPNYEHSIRTASSF
jgi:hypothetical protein